MPTTRLYEYSRKIMKQLHEKKNSNPSFLHVGSKASIVTGEKILVTLARNSM